MRAPLMTPDGRLVVPADSGVKALDGNTLRVIRRYPVSGGSILSPDGSTLTIGNPDGGIGLLDLASGRVRTLTNQPLEPEAFSPDGRTLSISEDGGSVILWDVEKGIPTETLEGHAAVADRHAFSPDGRTLYTAGDDGRVIVWDVAGDRRLGRPFPTGRGYEGGEENFTPAFALSPDGRALAVARLDGRVELIDAETLRRTASFEAFPGRAAVAIDYSADGRRLAVAGEGGGVGVWDAESGEQLGALLRAPRGPRGPETLNSQTVSALAFGQGDLLAAAEAGGAVRIWDLGRRELLRAPLRLPPSVYGLAFSPDGSQLAIPFGAFSGEGPNGVEILDVGSGERVARLSTDGEVGSVAFSPDGSLLAGGEVDGGALLWATDGWRRVGGPLALRERVHSRSGVLPGRAHTCDLTLGPLGGALGRRLAGADRAPPDRHDRRTWGRDPGDGAIHPRRRPPFRGIRSRARNPLGGRSRRLEAAGLPADGRRPDARKSGRRSLRSTTTSRSAPPADGRPPRAPNRSLARLDHA